jgi:uncharacterized protein YjbI with pentapeptide repeats
VSGYMIFSYNYRPKGIADFKAGDKKLAGADLVGLESSNPLEGYDFNGADLAQSTFNAKVVDSDFTKRNLTGYLQETSRYGYGWMREGWERVNFDRTVFEGMDYSVATRISKMDEMRSYGIEVSPEFYYFSGVEDIPGYGPWIHSGTRVITRRFHSSLPPLMKDCRIANLRTNYDLSLRTPYNNAPHILRECKVEGVDFRIGSPEKSIAENNRLRMAQCFQPRVEAYETTFINCDFSGLSFDQFVVQDCRFINCRFDFCMFSGPRIRIRRSLFENCTFRRTYWWGDWATQRQGRKMTPVKDSKFVDCDFSAPPFEECDSILPPIASKESRDEIKWRLRNDTYPHLIKIREQMGDDGRIYRWDLIQDIPPEWQRLINQGFSSVWNYRRQELSRQIERFEQLFAEDENDDSVGANYRPWIVDALYGQIDRMTHPYLRDKIKFNFHFKNCEFLNCNFDNRVNRLSFKDSELKGCTFRNNTFRNYQFLRSAVLNCDFTGSMFERGVFRQVSMQGSIMRGISRSRRNTEWNPDWPRILPKKNLKELRAISPRSNIILPPSDELRRNKIIFLPNWEGPR